MLKVGLTGGIGSGKTTVAKIFTIFGISVFYADEATKRLMNEDGELKASIIRNFGDESYKDGQLNSPYIASIVFNDPEKLKLLNSITHPATIRMANEWMERQKGPYAIKEAALIFESGAEENLDYIIGVYAPRELRIKRVRERDKVSEEEIVKRMNRQINDDLKMKLCDFVIVNDEHEMVIPQVLAVHEILLAKARQYKSTISGT